MKIKKIIKLIFTKNGHHFRQVKHLRNDGIYQVVTDEKTYVFCDKKEIEKVGELFEYIQKKRIQWERNKKMEELLN